MSSTKRGESSGSVGSKAKNTNSDALSTEFQYYGSAIRNLAPALTDPVVRGRAELWINKLFGAEYHVETLREKRNRYLAALTVNMINDELTGVFADDPPMGTLPDLMKMKVLNARISEWENDTTWPDYLSTLPDNFKKIPCTYHCGDDGSCSQESSTIVDQLDNEFRFLLYQIRPYAALIPCSDAKTKVASWIQALCGLGCKNCDKMAALRNDYATLLYGYVRDLRVAGPFQDCPSWDRLLPLQEAARISAKKYPLTSPCSAEATSFLELQPTPEEGAFCYIAATGEMANPDTLLPY